MKFSIVLTPSEAKKFIAKALVNKHETFKKALDAGHVLMHPSTTTLFIHEELTGRKPEGLWFVGAVAPWGNCISATFEEIVAQREKNFDHKNVRYAWFFKHGQLIRDITVSECYEQMGKGDFYLKGVNAVDPQENVGILIANPDGGTISRAKKQADERGFIIMLIATFNKLINVSIDEAASAARDLDWSLGVKARIFKFSAGDLFNEAMAFQLFGVKATPIASGGVNEADGAGVFVLEGEEKQLDTCLRVIDQCKGAKLPCILPSCHQCRYDKCPNSLANKDEKGAFDWLKLDWYH